MKTLFHWQFVAVGFAALAVAVPFALWQAGLGQGKETPTSPTSDSAQAPATASEPFQAVVPAEQWIEFPKDSPPVRVPESAPAIRTVHDAARRSCSSASVRGLSRQVIAEMRVLAPREFTPVPERANLAVDESAFLFLDASARDSLLATLKANRSRTMHVNSAFRTLPQQYLVNEWAKDNRCGVQIAAAPGMSNHELGLAIDIAEPDSWRAGLESHGFRWMGKIDRVHFDYVRRAPRKNGLDILAFQRLWNRHHGEDHIAENGQYSAATRTRLSRAPATGFPAKDLPSGG